MTRSCRFGSKFWYNGEDFPSVNDVTYISPSDVQNKINININQKTYFEETKHDILHVEIVIGLSYKPHRFIRKSFELHEDSKLSEFISEYINKKEAIEIEAKYYDADDTLVLFQRFDRFHY